MEGFLHLYPLLLTMVVPLTKINANKSKVIRKGKIPHQLVRWRSFLRIIKKSDYKVVDQINQTPSKISMLSLLMCSEAHIYALVNFLRAAHVSQEIFICQFEGVVNNITLPV